MTDPYIAARQLVRRAYETDADSVEFDVDAGLADVVRRASTGAGNPLYDPRCDRSLPIPGAGCARDRATCVYPECTFPEPADQRP